MKNNKSLTYASAIAAITSASTLALLIQFEGNVLSVYADPIARGLPTMCAGHTDRKAVVGTKLTSDQCKEINKSTLLKYGTAILGCVDWNQLNKPRLVSLTLFAVNVGIDGACGSQAVAHINSGDVEAGCDLIAHKPSGAPNWSYVNGKLIPGLYKRRLAESKLCSQNSY